MCRNPVSKTPESHQRGYGSTEQVWEWDEGERGVKGFLGGGKGGVGWGLGLYGEGKEGFGGEGGREVEFYSPSIHLIHVENWIQFYSVLRL